MEKEKTEGYKKDEVKNRGRPTLLIARERTWSEGQATGMKCLDDYIKRKREEEAEGEDSTEVFKRSNLIVRSPRKEKELSAKETTSEKEIILKEVMIEMMEMRKELSNMVGEVREGFKDQGRMMRLEMEELRKEYKEQLKMWVREEREELKREMEEMKERIRRLEERKSKEEEGNKEIETEIIRKTTEKLREEGEKEKRRNSIVIKRIEEKEKEAKEVVEELWRIMDTEAKIEEIREISKGEGRGGRMISVKLRERADKTQIMRKKKALKGRKEKIQDDWTWKEREMQWKLEKIAWEERKKGKTAQVRYGRIWKEGKWWKWNEDEEKLMEKKIKSTENSGGERRHEMEKEEMEVN